MKKFKNFLLITPDILSSSTGLLLAPIFLFLTLEGIATFAIVSLCFIFLDSYVTRDYKFYFYLSIVLLFFPLFLINKKKYFFDKKYFYIYLFFIWVSLGLDWLNLKDYLVIFENQHTHFDARFAAFSLEPSFFAETFFPVFLLVLNTNERRIKALYLISFFVFFYFSLSRTLIQDVLIYCLSLLIAINFSSAYFKKQVLIGYLIFVISFILFFKNITVLDEFISYTLDGLNSWRTVSNVSAIASSEFINFPISFSYDGFRSVAQPRFGMYGIEAIFSAFPYIAYSWGVVAAIAWSFFILSKALPEKFSLNRVASIIALLVIYLFFSPKWNFVCLYAILYLRNMGEIDHTKPAVKYNLYLRQSLL